MASLLDLSHELLHCIFTEVEPRDLAALSATCRAAHCYIDNNQLLHKELYLRFYDDPTLRRGEPDWTTHLHNVVKLEQLLDSPDLDVKRDELPFVAEQVNYMVETACADPKESANVRLLAEHFDDTDNQNVFLCSSGIWRIAGTRAQEAAPTVALRQASAKLHCLYGKAIEVVPNARPSPAGLARLQFFAGTQGLDLSAPPFANTRSKEIPGHSVARAKVYDLREYTEDTLWGPFMDDGTQDVDWEKVEAVMMVLAFNLQKFTQRTGGRFPAVWDKPFFGATPGSYISPEPSPGSPHACKDADEELFAIRELLPDVDQQDPYGVSGIWMRVVCFLDYNDLYAFNFTDRIPPYQARLPINIEEAIRLIRMKLQVTRIDPPGTGDDGDEDDGLDWSKFKGERLPVVRFRGLSRSLHASWDPNANSRLRGTVRQTPQGEIRWTTFSIFHGEERWRSEGIQVGGLRSGRGVLGNWFDKDYDFHGPAGPTAFWKETDDLKEDRHGNQPEWNAYDTS